MIRKLWLKGWKSHEDTHLTFTRGTNVLVGIMGSGKSSVLQAITFALFGDIPEVRGRKLALSGLIMRKPRRLDSAKVALEFDVGDTIYRVERVIGKKTDAKLYREGRVWEVGPRRVTEKICELLNTDYDSFANVVYARQNEIDNFLRYGKAERVNLIDGLLKIDRLEDARKNLRSFHTGVKKQLEGLKARASKDLSEQRALLENAERQLASLKGEMSDVQAEIHALKERLSAKRLKLNSLEELRDKVEQLRSRLDRLRGEEKALGARLMGLPEVEGAADRLARLESEMSGLRSREKELLSRVSSLKSRRAFLESKVRELSGFREVAGKEVPDLTREIERLGKELARVDAELDARRAAIEQLRSASSTCPVCGSPLKDPEKHIAEHEAAVSRLSKERARLEGMLSKLEAEREKAEKARAEVERARAMVRELEKYEAELKKLGRPPEEELALVGEKLRKLEAEREGLRKAVEREELAGRLEEIGRQKGALEAQLSRLSFDEAEYRKAREEVLELEKALSAASAKLSQLPKLISARESEIASLKREIQDVEDAKKEAARVEAALERLSILINAIVDVQVLVRKGFVELVNELLGDIWAQLYPYGDYSSLRIFVEEEGRRAGDYVLQLRERKGWVNVDGVASGGERSIASLALRVAFARALSRLDLLLLDEPTHNLDEQGIDKLATVLREGLPSVLEQVVIITHEERMEPAATGAAYRLVRDKASEEPTRVEEI